MKGIKYIILPFLSAFIITMLLLSPQFIFYREMIVNFGHFIMFVGGAVLAYFFLSIVGAIFRDAV